MFLLMLAASFVVSCSKRWREEQALENQTLEENWCRKKVKNLLLHKDLFWDGGHSRWFIRDGAGDADYTGTQKSATKNRYRFFIFYG